VCTVQPNRSRLREHVAMLTRTIGERSLRKPESLGRTAEYIQGVYQGLGLETRREPYVYGDLEVANIIARLEGDSPEGRRYLLGAHYDTVSGTVGADDNASAVAVQLETARCLTELGPAEQSVSFVSFALEEPPAFGTRFMGSKVHVRNLKKRRERLDGMLCLEMVGYACYTPGCQDYPISLKRLIPSDMGDFIAVVGSTGSRRLTRDIKQAFQDNPDLPVFALNVPLKGALLPPVRMSDQAPFWDAGYKAVMITDTAFYRNPHYHKASDTMETLDFGFMAELVESLVCFFDSAGLRQRLENS